MAKEIKYEAVISDKKGEPDDQKLYDRVKAEAAKKFEVYPSAVANGWVVQEYKRRGGTYSVPKATKGIQVDNIENLKTELAKAEERLADITDSLAKGGPGSGPHKGGGDSSPDEAHHDRMAVAHEKNANFHREQANQAMERAKEALNNKDGETAQTHMATAGKHVEAALANERATGAHGLASVLHYMGNDKADSASHEAEMATSTANSHDWATRGF